MNIWQPNPKYNITVIDNIFPYNVILDIYSGFSTKLAFFPKNHDLGFDPQGMPKFRGDLYDKNLPQNLDFHNKRSFKLLSSEINNIVLEKFPIPLTLGQCYVNYSTSDSLDRFHVDQIHPLPTVLYYANHSWEFNWGGETLFLNEQGSEIVAAVIPKPGRIVIFDGNIGHSARPPSILASCARMTVALKYHEQ